MQDQHCLQVCSWFTNVTILASVRVSKCREGSVCFRNSGLEEVQIRLMQFEPSWHCNFSDEVVLRIYYIWSWRPLWMSVPNIFRKLKRYCHVDVLWVMSAQSTLNSVESIACWVLLSGLRSIADTYGSFCPSAASSSAAAAASSSSAAAASSSHFSFPFKNVWRNVWISIKFCRTLYHYKIQVKFDIGNHPPNFGWVMALYRLSFCCSFPLSNFWRDAFI